MILNDKLAKQWRRASAGDALAGHQYEDGRWVVSDGFVLFEFDDIEGTRVLKQLAKGMQATRFQRMKNAYWVDLLKIDVSRSFPVYESIDEEEAEGEEKVKIVYQTKRGRIFNMGAGYYNLMWTLIKVPTVRAFQFSEKDAAIPSIFLVYDKKALLGTIAITL